MDVKYFLGSKQLKLEEFEKYGEEIIIHQLNDGTVIENAKGSQHVFLAKDGVVFDNEEAMRDAFDSNWDINTQIALESEDALIEGDTKELDQQEPHSIGKVIRYEQKTNSMEIEVEINEPGYVLVSSNYFLGWKAYIDDKETDIFRSYFFLKGIKINEPGTHKIVFKFLPDSIVYGLVISAASVLSSIVLFTILIRRENKS